MRMLYWPSRLLRISRDGSIGVVTSLQCLKIRNCEKYAEHRQVASPTESLGELCLKMRIETHNVHYWRLYLRKKKKKEIILGHLCSGINKCPAGTVRSDCNEEDMLGSTESKI